MRGSRASRASSASTASARSAADPVPPACWATAAPAPVRSCRLEVVDVPLYVDVLEEETRIYFTLLVHF